MEVQALINLLIVSIVALLGWSLKNNYNVLNNAIDSIKSDVQNMRSDVHELDKLVAGDYVKRIEFAEHISKLFQKLDEISEKLNKKADRRNVD